MSSINGVHALLALLMQQAHPTKQAGEIKIDLKQLDLLLQESRLLNERLLSIEKLLSSPQSHSTHSVNTIHSNAATAEGNWPAAALIRDLINIQERQQAFGNWQSDTGANLETDPFSHREVEERDQSTEQHQLLIQKYVPTDSDLAWAEISANYGVNRRPHDTALDVHEREDLVQASEERSRLLVIAIGMALLLLALFAAVG